MSAPVCPISRDQAVAGQPTLRLPSIPIAVDLPSAIAGLHQIQQLLIQMTTPPIVNNIGFPFLPTPTIGNPRQDNGGGGGGGGKNQDWQETHRCYEIIRVVDPFNQRDNYVDIPVLRWLMYKDMNKQDMQLEYLLNI